MTNSFNFEVFIISMISQDFRLHFNFPFMLQNFAINIFMLLTKTCVFSVSAENLHDKFKPCISSCLQHNIAHEILLLSFNVQSCLHPWSSLLLSIVLFLVWKLSLLILIKREESIAPLSLIKKNNKTARILILLWIKSLSSLRDFMRW